jgi:hypothetical protein
MGYYSPEEARKSLKLEQSENELLRNVLYGMAFQTIIIIRGVLNCITGW